MKQKRAVVTVGVIGLQLILLVAVFALGVYVGRYLLDGDQPASTEQQQNAVGQSDLPPGLDTPADLIGTVVRISDGRIEVETSQELRTVLVDGQTTYRDHERHSLALSDLQPPMIIVVYGQPDPNRGGFVGREIVLLPPPNQGP